MSELVLLRHGRSEWNDLNLFTGWYDCDLTPGGRAEATAAGVALREAGVAPDVLHTSLLTRAVRTADLALDELDRLWLPVRRSWRLNERHYGALQGLNKAEVKAEFGDEKLMLWRRSYDTPPEPVEPTSEHHPANDARYRELPPDVLPATECLKDVMERMLPYWYDDICPDLAAGRSTLVVAHGNSLRALVKHLQGLTDAEVVALNIPTGVPLRYELGPDFHPTQDIPVEQRYLGDAEAAAAAAAAVARQAG